MRSAQDRRKQKTATSGGGEASSRYSNCSRLATGIDSSITSRPRKTPSVTVRLVAVMLTRLTR